MARRRSFMAQRLQKMKGIPPEERDLLVRIGRTIDGAINNRGPTNPSSDGVIRVGRADPKLPPPDNITEKRGIQSVKLQWDAVDSPRLAHYRVIFQRLSDGASFTRSAYEPQITFNGSAGDYKVYISSIGRNGKSSLQKEFNTTLLDNVMLLEGAKNSVDVTGTTISETVYVPRGYTVFIWAAFTLNDFAIFNTNTAPNAVLKRSTVDDITTAADVQTLDMYAESETLTSTDDLNGIAPLTITRPENLSGPPARPSADGLNETSQTLMFSPLILDDEDTNKDHTFFLSIEDRLANDIQGLSIVIWVATAGRGFDTEFPIVSHLNCAAALEEQFKLSSPKFESFANFTSRGNEYGNPAFTYSMWFKIVDDFPASTQFITARHVSTNIINFRYLIAISSNNVISSLVLGSPSNSGIISYTDATAGSPFTGVLLPSGIDNWVHHVITYETVPFRRIRLYVNGSLAVSSDVDDSVNTFGVNSITTQDFDPAPTTINLTNCPVFSSAPTKEPIVRLYEMAFWKKLLEPEEIVELYNSGDGSEIILNEDFGDYISSEDLTIYWRWGSKPFGLGDYDIGTLIDADNLPGFQGSLWTCQKQDITFTDLEQSVEVVDDYPGK